MNTPKDAKPPWDSCRQSQAAKNLEVKEPKDTRSMVPTRSFPC
jgi:hypothetical protein